MRLLQEMHFFAFFRDRKVVGAGARCGAGWWGVCVRNGLYKMLQKMGVPESLRTLIIALHTDFMVKIKSGLEDVETSYTQE